MKNKLILLLLCAITLVIFLLPQLNACGCGLAIAEQRVFNALKETQAYLLIDVLDANNYNEMPFFRMVSMDEPYNVTIVFPINQIPYDVEGKSLPAEKFLADYKINLAENVIVKQSISGLTSKVAGDLRTASSTAFTLSNGFIGVSSLFLTGATKLGGTMGGLTKGLVQQSLVAHFEFEGGSLDIYNITSMETLEEFVRTINITLTGKVKELVTKYKDYYVAVLYLNVPSALNADLRNQLLQCPEQTENVKQKLQEKTEFKYSEMYGLTAGPCQAPLEQLITSVTRINSNLNGTLVNMKFSNTNKFFYPTSIVNSYKYPITEQKYFIRTPTKLNIDLSSSKVDKTATFDSKRWYKISSTEQDINGKIIAAGISTKFSDVLRAINQAIYENSGLIVFIIYLTIILAPFLLYHYMADESLTKGEIVLAIVLFIVGGLLLTTLIMLFKKKKLFALTLFLLWLILLVMMLIF